MLPGNIPSRKKVAIPVNQRLWEYLHLFNRAVSLPLHYEDLMNYSISYPLVDAQGNDTLWETVYYTDTETQELYRKLTLIYALLKTDGDISVMEHLQVSRIDFCTFGNTHPFRIRISNRLNDNYDHYYIKRIDASRIYGLELEELLSPNSVVYLVDGQTLVEEHIAGIPGDDFMKTHLAENVFNQTRIAKEFIKFNERCFVRLLGDMRSYNYVVVITPDIEGFQYRLRAIDFDQQSYEDRKSFYLPQYFKENNAIIQMGVSLISNESLQQYQLEERSLIAARVKAERERVNMLIKIMVKDPISTPEKVNRLKEDLIYHHKNDIFKKCNSMGEIVRTNIQMLLQKDFKHNIILEENF